MQRLVLFVAASIGASAVSSACLWDYDTLAMERQRFPDAQELIAGHFVRHSAAYYEWRIADRSAKPIESRTPQDFDDIAVAYDKLGQHRQAIDTILAKMDRWPNEGIYESEANLGTFYIHSGRFKKGLQHVRRAIEINPEAHFGREVYQQLLVEYVIQQHATGQELPLNDEEAFGTTGFAKFVIAKQQPADSDQDEEIEAAVRGVMGMMRFGQHDSPILLEALGDLLLFEGNRKNSRMLAARAYLKASYEVGDPAVASAYREKSTQTLKMQLGRELSEIEGDLKNEIEQGEQLIRRISEDEQQWIAADRNLDELFAAKYYEAPPLELNRPHWKPVDPGTDALVTFGGLAVLLIVGAPIAAFILRKMLR
jgi:tetratricopeptide (TPR) repeat protein